MQNSKVLFGMVVAIGLVAAAKDEEKARPNTSPPISVGGEVAGLQRRR